MSLSHVGLLFYKSIDFLPCVCNNMGFIIANSIALSNEVFDVYYTYKEEKEIKAPLCFEVHF